ncbi:hypothetical protein [Pedobacter sp. SYP-B3415]|uniref:hypothetical protein n=1 Tax=Pedobacter sp. SYP-B3415 TaxID=2496641 RepID=UPI00101D646E|nr:hypothetical protein [Pedobacter sp. SYP-B3415]
MKTYMKGCLVLILILVLVLAGIVGWYNWRKDRNQQQAETDLIKFSGVCDSVSLISEKPTIQLQNFNKSEISRLKFYLLSAGKVTTDTTVHINFPSANIPVFTQLPFSSFLKTDTIVLETQGRIKRHYFISGFRHYVYLHYGMMGYLGTYDCRLDNDRLVINGKETDGILSRQAGITGAFLLSKRP